MDFRGLVANLIGLINTVIPVLITLALVFFFWGIVRYLYKSGDAHGKEADKQIFIWGLIALFVMVSVWGIISTLCLSFFGDSQCDPVNTQSVQNSPSNPLLF